MPHVQEPARPSQQELTGISPHTTHNPPMEAKVLRFIVFAWQNKAPKRSQSKSQITTVHVER
eukprot:3338968-Amphidinium_carterae.1